MKKFALVALLLCASSAYAKDLRVLVVKTETRMKCENCAKKIRMNLRFEKGVKDIKPSVADQTVSITYDAEKGTQEGIVKGFKKIGYKVKVLSEKKAEKK